MPYIASEVVQEAKRMDLLAYLKNYEPYEFVCFSDKESGEYGQGQDAG